MDLVWLGVGLGVLALIAIAFTLLDRAARIIGQRLAGRTRARPGHKPSGLAVTLGVVAFGALWLTVMIMDGVSVLVWIIVIAAAISFGMGVALAAGVWLVQYFLDFSAAVRDVAKETVEMKARRGEFGKR